MNVNQLPDGMFKHYNESEKRFGTPLLRKLYFGNVDELAKRTNESATLAAVAVQAQRAWEGIYETHWGAMRDQTATEAARLVRSATFARSQLKGANEALTKALDMAERKFAVMEQDIDAALAPSPGAGQATIDAEMRAYLRTKDAGEVLGVIRSDPDALRAAVTAPAALSGLSKDAWVSLRRQYLESKVPEVFADFNDLHAAVKSATKAVTHLEKETGALVDLDTAAQLEKVSA